MIKGTWGHGIAFSECCDGVALYLLCENEECPIIHQFAICEICGQSLNDEQTPANCKRPDGWE